MGLNPTKLYLFVTILRDLLIFIANIINGHSRDWKLQWQNELIEMTKVSWEEKSNHYVYNSSSVWYNWWLNTFLVIACVKKEHLLKLYV